MKSAEIRRRFLAFFEKRGHAIIPSAPLIPENDPTVLFNTAGMQPLVPYLMGRPHPQGDKLADVQKCLRTTDIEDIGDNTHATFFEMLGNWSLGSYFKEEAIKWSYEFLTSKDEGLGLDPARLYVTVFEGLKNEDGSWLVPPDEDAKRFWLEAGMPEHRIYSKGADANWWPAVKGKDTWTGPTGPCSEMFYDVTEEGIHTNKDGGVISFDEYCAADESQQLVEIWNDVFMEFEKKDGVIVGKLEKKNVDTGAGFERICAVLQKKTNIFDTDCFDLINAAIRERAVALSSGETPELLRARRIVADHVRASTMLISDGALPANSDQGYILRRLIRRAVRYADTLGMPTGSLEYVARAVAQTYVEAYPNVIADIERIVSVLNEEESRFRKTLDRALKEFERIAVTGAVSGTDAFDLYQSYGLPIEMTVEFAKERGISVDTDAFAAKLAEHEALSRAGAEQKFKGGLGDDSEISLKYHTATHLLHQALRDVLGTHVQQKGSNITPERLRFDFANGAKMTDDEKARVEAIVNEKIAADLPVQMVVLPKAEAEASGALHFFGDKYGDEVSVYYIGETLEGAWSKEFCGGPHAERTGTLGVFKIGKEEAVSAGVRRIKATLA
jgi:alanyl-tRNA synthetase